VTEQTPRPSAAREWHDRDEGADAAADRTYDPSTPQVNRSREQGLGVGRTEIDGQRDATRYPSSEQYGSGEGAGRDRSPGTGSDAAESLDDTRDQLEQGGQ